MGLHHFSSNLLAWQLGRREEYVGSNLNKNNFNFFNFYIIDCFIIAQEGLLF